MNASSSGPQMQNRAVRTRAKLLDAAVEVIKREGPSRLTLDKVAVEANVSKGGLLYHFSSKNDLITALLNRTLQTAGSNLEERAAPLGEARGAFATAYLEFMRRPYEATGEGDIASSILAAAALDKNLLEETDLRFQRWQQRILDDGLSESLALLVRVVSDGLWLMDSFRLAPLDVDQRGALIDLVEQLIHAELDQK